VGGPTESLRISVVQWASRRDLLMGLGFVIAILVAIAWLTAITFSRIKPSSAHGGWNSDPLFWLAIGFTALLTLACIVALFILVRAWRRHARLRKDALDVLARGPTASESDYVTAALCVAGAACDRMGNVDFDTIVGIERTLKRRLPVLWIADDEHEEDFVELPSVGKRYRRLDAVTCLLYGVVIAAFAMIVTLISHAVLPFIAGQIGVPTAALKNESAIIVILIVAGSVILVAHIRSRWSSVKVVGQGAEAKLVFRTWCVQKQIVPLGEVRWILTRAPTVTQRAEVVLSHSSEKISDRSEIVLWACAPKLRPVGIVLR
jgi:hypothetical protein